MNLQLLSEKCQLNQKKKMDKKLKSFAFKQKKIAWYIGRNGGSE